jgi:hypothetical protein
MKWRSRAGERFVVIGESKCTVWKLSDAPGWGAEVCDIGFVVALRRGLKSESTAKSYCETRLARYLQRENERIVKTLQLFTLQEVRS